MKNQLIMKLAAIAVATIALAPALQAQLNITNANGSDGQLVVNSGTNIINLANAPTGSWLTTSASPGNGTYDPTQWAVVFKYSNVVISAGAKVKFINHLSHAPVVWLVNGSVTISGELDMDGQNSTSDSINLPEPGPGGFRGGGGVNGLANTSYGPGFGPGGYAAANSSSVGSYYFGVYGNPQIIPLIGGSGGPGYTFNGAGGGGAILIAASNNITINASGYCHANGGDGSSAGGGSGGGIRMVANQILGTGRIEALGGSPGGGVGRIRLEGNPVSGTLTNNPITAGVAVTNPPTIFPPTNATTVAVESVQNINVPPDPKAIMSGSTGADDLSLVTTNNVTIKVRTLNFPTNGTVTVFIKPRNHGDPYQESYPQSPLIATFFSGTTNSALWQVTNVALPYPAHTVIQARASQ